MSSVQVKSQPAPQVQPKSVQQKRVLAKEIKKADPVLPPCLICGGKSSGYHFGIISCESCKIFFRRSLSRETPYQCKKNNKCEIGPGRWSSCSACRLNKCVQLGMSVEGVKRGRHSLERKSNCENMVKSLKEEEKKKQDEKQQLQQERKEELEVFANKLYELHMRNQLVNPEILKTIQENEDCRKGMDELVEDVTGSVEPLPPEFIQGFYELTGLDLGGVRGKLQLCLTTCHETLIKKCIEFSKEVPFFMDLPITDRILLVKATILEWYTMSGFQAVNWKDKMYSCVMCGVIYTDEEYHSIFPSVDFVEGLRPSHSLQLLGLHEEEIAILRCFVFFETSRSTEDFLEREKIDLFQNEYLECLLYVLEKHRGPKMAPQIFAKMTDALVQSRSMTAWKVDLIVKVHDTYKDLQLSQLVMEIYNVNYLENLNL